VEHPKDIGDRSTLAVMAALRTLEYQLFIPFGENTRIDLVIDDAYVCTVSSARQAACATARFGSRHRARTRTTEDHA
jgi:hypothetical protein